MKFKKLCYQTGSILLLIITMASCQEDLISIGSEILGSEESFGTLDDSYTVTAFSRKINPVQSNNLPGYQLGVYKDPVYGKSKINFLSQLILKSTNPKFGDSATVDSVFLYIPYFSNEEKIDTTRTYTLDSIYGNSPVNIGIYESKYYLRDYDPASGFEKPQAYYTDEGDLFDGYIGQEIGRIESFKPSSKGFVFPPEKEDEESEYLAPGLRVKLDSIFFQERIIDKEGSQELRNNTNFKDYFRGLYLKIDGVTDAGNLFLFDVSKAQVLMHYSYSSEDDERKSDVLEFEFKGISVNTIENDPLPNYVQSALENVDEKNGEENLFLRGGEGIMTIINLFGEDEDDDGVPEELELLRAKNWLINEANLIFYVNQDLYSGGDSEPERIMIYNTENNTLLADYNTDPTGGLPPNEAYLNHLEKIERGSDGKGKYYKIRITDHISNLINKDSTNVPLGLVVSQNVNIRSFQKLSAELEPKINEIPASSVISPKGTILHGNTSPNQEKRLKLQIFYTEPN